MRFEGRKQAIYDPETNRLMEFKGLPEFSNTYGACYITLNSRLFVQVGGYARRPSKHVSLFSLTIEGEEGEGSVTDPKVPNITMKQVVLSSLAFPRKYSGCGKVILNGKQHIVVAGGEANGIMPKQVEYLSLNMQNIRKGPKCHDKWKLRSNLSLPRTLYPSVGVLGNEIVVAGGSCRDDDNNQCSYVERFDPIANSRKLEETLKLSKSRHSHNTFQISEKTCAGLT